MQKQVTRLEEPTPSMYLYTERISILPLKFTGFTKNFNERIIVVSNCHLRT